MKLEHMRVFIAVAEAGELAEAGRRIGRTPAALSMTLKQIEDELAGLLFEGERKGRLTPLGAYVLVSARRAVAEFDGAMQHIRHYASGGFGLVQVAAVPSAATRVLPVAIARLRAQHPDVRIDLRDIDSAAVVEAVSTGGVDFGIATLSNALGDLVAEPLLEDPFMLVCPAQHRLVALGRTVRWPDIEPSEFIANGLCARIAAPEVAKLAAGSRLTVRNTTSLLHFVEQGFGVTLLPALAVPTSNAVYALPLADRQATRKLDLLTRPSETVNPASNALIEILRKVAGGCAGSTAQR